MINTKIVVFVPVGSNFANVEINNTFKGLARYLSSGLPGTMLLAGKRRRHIF